MAVENDMPSHSRVFKLTIATVCDFWNDGMQMRRVFWPFESEMMRNK